MSGQPPETVDEFTERVLYGPGGFYTTGGWTDARRARLAPIIAAVEARKIAELSASVAA